MGRYVIASFKVIERVCWLMTLKLRMEDALMEVNTDGMLSKGV